MMHHKFTVIVLGVLFVFLLGACPAAGDEQYAQDVDTILDKAEQALGGHTFLADIQAVRIRSHGMWEMPSKSIPPTPFETELVFQRPNRVYLLWKFPEEMGGTFKFGCDGKDAWGEYGGPPARSKGWHREVILQLVAEPQLYLIAPARAEHGDAFAVAAVDEVADPGLVKLTYRPIAGNEPWNVWFSKDTGQLVILEHESYQMDGSLALFRGTRSAPQNFAGLNYPSRSKFEALRDGKVIEAGEETIDSMEINPELPANFFACPQWKTDLATIGVKDVGEESVVKYLHRGPYTDIGKSLGPMMDVIMASGLVPVGAASGTYLNEVANPNDELTELAVQVAKVREGDPNLPAGYEFTTRPAQRVAYAYHRGDHMQEGEAHARLRAWMAKEVLQPAGPPRGIWFHDPEVTVTEDLVTEVQIPVSK